MALLTRSSGADCAGLLLLLTLPAAHGQERGLEISGGVTGILLSANDARLGNDQTLSADLFIEKPTQGGGWLAYLEANSTLDRQGLSTLVPESNADAGTALDPDRNGRIQVSEFSYRFDRDYGHLTAGLIDPSRFLDRSRITNDENVQFLGVAFVNNPTIEFPDYTMGVAWERPAGARLPALNAVVASSHGIADNPNLSYSQLIQITENDKGVFGALGLGWLGENSLLRLGAWFNTRDHASLDGNESGLRNYGLYAVLGRSWNDHGLNLRFGLANDKVTQGSEYIAVAYRLRWRLHAFGIGLARTFVSGQDFAATLDDSVQLEIFGRFTPTEATHVTLSMQKIRNSAFFASNADPRSSLRIVGLRLHYAF